MLAQFDDERLLIVRKLLDSDTIAALTEVDDSLIASDRAKFRQRRNGVECSLARVPANQGLISQFQVTACR